MVQKKTKKKKWWLDKKLGFYSLLMFFPLAQFLIFYIGVNTNSILMAFQEINIKNNTVEWTMSNIKNAFEMMTTSPELLSVSSVSIIFYVLLTVIGLPLGLFFSYYIYKKLPLSGAFRVLLFLPSIISSIVVGTIFLFFMERALPAMMMQFFDIEIQGLLENTETRFVSILIYNILISFGTNVLMYTNGMSGISPDLTEAAELDGASPFQEFWYITLPMIYPTISMFLITGVASIFTNQVQLFALYGTGAPSGFQTYGYYFYMHTFFAQSKGEYSILAAMGLLMTVVVVPLTFLVKWVLEKFGPSEN